VVSIFNWDEFQKYFLKKFAEEKTSSMLLIGEKEKVKDFNQNFTTILNNFPIDVALDDSITVDYYTKALP